jgi:hypothetical protein
MKSIPIDEKHDHLLRKIIDAIGKRGESITEKRYIEGLIESAFITEQANVEPKEKEMVPLEQDPAWLALDEAYDFGIEDLSENVDKYLYADGDNE